MTLSGPAFKARCLVEGEASGEALVLSEPLSFWGGLDPACGEIIDRHHPQVGERVSGKVLVGNVAMNRGSCRNTPLSSSKVQVLLRNC